MFDLETYAKETKITVSCAKLEVRDLRTGETRELMFYRPGDVFPLTKVERDLYKFGFEVTPLAMPDSPKTIVDWKPIYEQMTGAA